MFFYREEDTDQQSPLQVLEEYYENDLMFFEDFEQNTNPQEIQYRKTIVSSEYSDSTEIQILTDPEYGTDDSRYAIMKASVYPGVDVSSRYGLYQVLVTKPELTPVPSSNKSSMRAWIKKENSQYSEPTLYFTMNSWDISAMLTPTYVRGFGVILDFNSRSGAFVRPEVSSGFRLPEDLNLDTWNEYRLDLTPIFANNDPSSTKTDLNFKFYVNNQSTIKFWTKISEFTMPFVEGSDDDASFRHFSIALKNNYSETLESQEMTSIVAIDNISIYTKSS